MPVQMTNTTTEPVVTPAISAAEELEAKAGYLIVDTPKLRTACWQVNVVLKY
jgi:hypothetical protein